MSAVVYDDGTHDHEERFDSDCHRCHLNDVFNEDCDECEQMVREAFQQLMEAS